MFMEDQSTKDPKLKTKYFKTFAKRLLQKNDWLLSAWKGSTQGTSVIKTSASVVNQRTNTALVEFNKVLLLAGLLQSRFQ